MKQFMLLFILICGLWPLNGCGSGSGTTQQVATHFSVTSANAAPTAGIPFNVSVTALGASGQTVTTYSGTVHFASTDGQAVLPASLIIANGMGTFSATLKTAGPQTITATDTASLTGMSGTITVSAPPSPVPLVYQPLSPAAVVPGGAAFTLTVNGTGFVSGAQVNWNGSARTTTFVNESKLTASIKLSDIASVNTASVTVVNPAPGGGKSNAVLFEVTNPNGTSFTTAATLPAGSGPSAVATGDFNGDGKVDLAVVNESSDNVSVFLSNGDGTFQAAVNYSVASLPMSIAVGDFNGDGKLDLAVVNNMSDSVSVLLGKGDGTFQPAVNYGVGSNPTSVAVGDFNGDGKLDLVVGDFVAPNSNLSVLLGNGDGTFQTSANNTVGIAATSVAVGDFNGDGKLDVALAGGHCKTGCPILQVLFGNGDGTFQPVRSFFNPTRNRANFVILGDINGDGNLDMIVTYSQPAISVFLGMGDGQFQAPVNYNNLGLAQTSVLAIGDFNGDGKLDMAVTSGAGVTILLHQ
jgi:hypothetical protein